MSSQQRALGSVSDLMAGLMMVFLFIAIAYMIEIKSSQQSLADAVEEARHERDVAEQARQAADAARLSAEEDRLAARQAEAAAEQTRQEAQQAQVRTELANRQMSEIADTYFKGRAAIDQALKNEFEDDLPRWAAEIVDGTVRFRQPEILFDVNRAELKDGFEQILRDFFPRYLRVLTSAEFRDEVEELRIEGHTSTEWATAVSDLQRYLNNADLSQRRAFAVLDFCYRLEASRPHDLWLIPRLRANGLSSAEPILKSDGSMDHDRSRRVEFKVTTRSAERIGRILEAGKTGDTE